MPTFDKIHPVRHRADDMFDLVADIEKYPEFVPLCIALTIKSRTEKKGRELLIADMSAGYRSVQETFTCRVLLNREEKKIDVSYIDGPFKYLNNEWRFEETGKINCDVYFKIDYEFTSKILGALMGSMFDAAFRKFTAAFEERANALYGNKIS